MKLLKQKAGILFLLAALIMAAGCGKEKEQEPEPEPAPVEIPGKEAEAEPPADTPAIEEPVAPVSDILSGTTWYLTAFVNVKTGEVKTPEPQSDKDVYVLQFRTDGNLSGYSSANVLAGAYAVDSLSGTVKFHGWAMTHAGEYTPDAYRFLDALEEVYAYELLEGELRVFENEDSYLQFKRQIPEKEPGAEPPADIATPGKLSGTTWQLAAFVNVKTGEVTPPQTQDRKGRYVLQFRTDVRLAGCSSSNELTGTYAVDSLSGTIKLHGWPMTFVGEYPDGDRFLDILKGVYAYELLEDELRLFENEDSYLQFKRYLK
jgi:heat shock protein HslJ